MSKPVIKTYIWHDGKCYFVSTIERDSSAMLGPRRYNETIVWELGERNERGPILFQDEDNKVSIAVHQKLVDNIYKRGPEAFKHEEDAQDAS